MFKLMRTKAAILGLVLFGSASTSAYIFIEHTKTGCEAQDGKWASTGSYCVKRDCFENGSCDRWANPGLRCARLKIDDPISEVYFQLGEPDAKNGNSYIWAAYKGAAEKINATIQNGKLVALMCPT